MAEVGCGYDSEVDDFEAGDAQRRIELRRIDPNETIEEVLARRVILREGEIGRGVPIFLDDQQVFGRVDWKEVRRIASGENVSGRSVGKVVRWARNLINRT